jgi:glycosyltransferase A (GT-A) superfamily protein (DUF2064 family)
LRTSFPHTAILLFTRSATEESKHKRFSNRLGRKGNTAIAHTLTAHTARVARSIGLDFITMGSAQQMGASFGERITQALASTFQRGYDKLIVIGNDCPSLNRAALEKAVQLLEDGHTVVGPARDGGVYLIGLSREHFQSASWLNLPWKTSTLSEALFSYLQQFNAPICSLPVLSDIDNEEDLIRMLGQKSALPVFVKLRSLLGSRITLLPILSTQPLLGVFVASTPHRGPPSR